jgi:hypothetical protein
MNESVFAVGGDREWQDCCDHCGCPPEQRDGHDDTCRFGCNDVPHTRWGNSVLADAAHWMIPPNVQGQGLCRTCRVTWPCDYAVARAVPADVAAPARLPSAKESSDVS